MSIFVHLRAILQVFRHIIYAIFFWQLIDKTTDYFNNIVFILVAKISSKKVCEKMENNSTLEKVLLVCNRNSELLRLVSATFDSRMRKKKLIILISLHRKSVQFFCFICLSLLTFELSNINWKYLENCNILTERTFSQYYNNLYFYCVIIKYMKYWYK